jgi:hypothetical protein
MRQLPLFDSLPFSRHIPRLYSDVLVMSFQSRWKYNTWREERRAKPALAKTQLNLTSRPPSKHRQVFLSTRTTNKMAANPTIKFVRSVSLTPPDENSLQKKTADHKNIRSGNLSEQTPAWSLGKFVWLIPPPHPMDTYLRIETCSHPLNTCYVQTLGWCKSRLKKKKCFGLPCLVQRLFFRRDQI